jgi:hypothetical protein
MTHESLDRSCVDALVGQFEAGAMTEHVWMNGHTEPLSDSLVIAGSQLHLPANKRAKGRKPTDEPAK